MPGQDAISLFNVDAIFPRYVEMEAVIIASRAKPGFGSNAYLVFDFYDVRDFKFAGIDAETGTLVLGHRGISGWVEDAELDVQARADTSYDLRVEMNDDQVTAYLDDIYQVSFTFARRMVGGQSYGVTTGMLGVGAESAVSSFDDLTVQVLPRPISLDDTDYFDASNEGLLNGASYGLWNRADDRLSGVPEAGSDVAVKLVDVGLEWGVNQASILELNGRLATEATGGYIFDRYDATDFKFAAMDAANGRVLIGHHTEREGWVVDASVNATIQQGKDYDFDVTLRGRNVKIELDGIAVLQHDFNGLVLDGEFGLLAAEGESSFDSFQVRSDDPALREPTAPAPQPETPDSDVTAIGGDSGATGDFAALTGSSAPAPDPTPDVESGVTVTEPVADATDEPVADPVEKTTWIGAVDPYLDPARGGLDDDAEPALDDANDDERVELPASEATTVETADATLPMDWVVDLGASRTTADDGATSGMENDWLIDTDRQRGPRRGF